MSDDLTSALHDLAADHRTAPPVPGAEIRRRGVARARRRRVAVAGAGLATAAVAVTVLAGLLTGHEDARPHRSPAPPATDEVRAPAAAVDLSRQRMTLDGRELPVSAGTAQHPTPTGRMTVVATHRTLRMADRTVGLGEQYDLTLPWVVELRTPDGGTTYAAALTYDEKAPGHRDVTHGMIGLRTEDARTLHDRLRPGDVITVRGGGTGR